jgi:ABC-type transport system involved in Fe-S cluster assembly fused permease/ATPase subunit
MNIAAAIEAIANAQEAAEYNTEAYSIQGYPHSAERYTRIAQQYACAIAALRSTQCLSLV